MDDQLADIALIFDLDGTLIETAGDLAAAMDHVLSRHGFATLGVDKVRHLVGHGARRMLAEGFGAAGAVKPEEEMRAHIDEFLDYYAANISVHSAPYPGMPDALDRLARAGAALSVCTNKPHDLAVALLDDLGLTPMFHTIVGVVPDRPAKPDPAQALLCFSRSRRNRAIFVGDSDTDIRTAQAISAPCLLAGFGYGPTTLQASTAGLFHNFDELPGLVERVAHTG